VPAPSTTAFLVLPILPNTPSLATLGFATLGLLLGSVPAGLPAQIPSAQELGWSPEGLRQVEAFTDSIGTAAFLLVTDGTVVASRGATTVPFRAHSIRKSLLSALVGIAVQEGEVDTTATLAALGINDRELLTPEERSATVLQLLQSRSGVYHPAASETEEARATRPARGSHTAGSHWYYNNWDFNVLGTIYAGGRGQTVGDAFRDRIVGPLGMQDFDVGRDFRHQLEPHLSRHLAYKFRLSARDLARFGRLYLQDGRWRGRTVLPPGWVAESTRAHSTTGQPGSKGGYGLMWWVTADGPGGLPDGSFTASGSGGQRLTILPGLRTVVVHLMDTDRQVGPRIGTSTWDELLRRLMAARTPG